MRWGFSGPLEMWKCGAAHARLYQINERGSHNVMTIQAIFWDCDNTLINTAAHHWHKHKETLRSLGITLEDRWYGRIYTNNGAQNWEWLHRELGLSLPLQEYLDAIDGWYFRHIGEITLREGVLEALTLAQQAKIPMAVVSNGRRRSVMAGLEAKQLPPYFRFILCKEDYQGRKPEPAPYLTAKTRMQQALGVPFDPAMCLVIEDDPVGVESGRAAGMQVIDRPPEDTNTQAFLASFKAFL